MSNFYLPDILLVRPQIQGLGNRHNTRHGLDAERVHSARRIQSSGSSLSWQARHPFFSATTYDCAVKMRLTCMVEWMLLLYCNVISDNRKAVLLLQAWQPIDYKAQSTIAALLLPSSCRKIQGYSSRDREACTRYEMFRYDLWTLSSSPLCMSLNAVNS
ncbi:hypothetical protein BDZ45DRAFT_167768 [Acephala macrosclerotiorum]|nr:hypothetical protein BDZ45DRAFT_167768 [Acephala macrosclerotiorum]